MTKRVLALVLMLCLTMMTAAYASEEPTDDAGLLEEVLPADAVDLTEEAPVVLVDAGIAIDEAHFPDGAFRTYIKANLDKDGNGTLSKAELSVEGMDCQEQGIQNLTGLSYFESLQFLWCGENELTGLDLSRNKNIMFLWCEGNDLKSLDVTMLPELAVLDCRENGMTELKLGPGVFLEQLYTHGNMLETLDVSRIPGLVKVLGYGTAQNRGTYTVYGYPHDKGFDDVFSVDNATLLVPDPNESVFINPQNFPDENFRAFVRKYDLDENGMLSETELSIESMDCAGQNIGSLKGIEYFTKIYLLDCSDNVLETLNMSGMKDLMLLWCSNNKLISLDVSGNSELSFLDCSGNALKSLDVSGNTFLEALFAQGNPLEMLDIRKNTPLRQALENGQSREYESYMCYGWDFTNSFSTVLSCDKDVKVVYRTDPGDTDENGTVESADLVRLMKYIIGIKGSEPAEGTGDLNSDKEITLLDVVCLLNRLVV